MNSGGTRWKRQERTGSGLEQGLNQPQYPSWIGCGILLLFVLPFLTGLGALGLWSVTGWEEDYSLPLALGATWLVVAYTYYSIQPAKGVRRYFALQGIPWRAAWRVPVCYLGVFMLVGGVGALIVALLVCLGLPAEFWSAKQALPDWPWAMELLAVVVIAPLGEELFFRGMLLQGLLQRYSATAAVLLSAGMFGLIHVGLVPGIVAFLTGCVLGWVFVETRSLWVTILMHATHNAFAMAVKRLGPQSGSRDAAATSAPGLPPAGTASVEEAVMGIGLLVVSAAVGWVVFYYSYPGLKRQLALGRPAVAPAGTGEAQGALRLSDFKARRSGRTAASD